MHCTTPILYGSRLSVSATIFVAFYIFQNATVIVIVIEIAIVLVIELSQTRNRSSQSLIVTSVSLRISSDKLENNLNTAI